MENIEIVENVTAETQDMIDDEFMGMKDMKEISKTDVLDGTSNSTQVQVSDEDAAFILGKNGRTKVKIARVSNAKLELHDGYENNSGMETRNLPFQLMVYLSSAKPVDGSDAGGSSQNHKAHLDLTITGSEEERERAQLYIRLIMKQRVGPVQVDFDPNRLDLTILSIPHEAVGYVTGSHGCVLRKIEDEWGTLMFFVGGQSSSRGTTVKHIDTGKNEDGQKLEQLLIFGPMRNRRGTELKIMSAVEQKCPSFFTTGVQEVDSAEEGFATDIMFIQPDDFSYALGKEGRTRKKLAKASGCILEYVGTMSERKRVREYLSWLITQRISGVVIETESRDDVTVLNIPTEFVPAVAGRYATGLRELEHRTGTFCFFEGGENKKEEKERLERCMERQKLGSACERLFVFGVDSSARDAVKRIVENNIESMRRRNETPHGNWPNPMRGSSDRNRTIRSRSPIGGMRNGYPGRGPREFDDRSYHISGHDRLSTRMTPNNYDFIGRPSPYASKTVPPSLPRRYYPMPGEDYGRIYGSDTFRSRMHASSKTRGLEYDELSYPHDVGHMYRDSLRSLSPPIRHALRVRTQLAFDPRGSRNDPHTSRRYLDYSENNYKDMRDGRNRKASREDAREGREIRDRKDTKEYRDLRENRGLREVREGRDTRESREVMDKRENRNTGTIKDTREPRENRDTRENRNTRETRYINESEERGIRGDVRSGRDNIYKGSSDSDDDRKDKRRIKEYAQFKENGSRHRASVKEDMGEGRERDCREKRRR